MISLNELIVYGGLAVIVIAFVCICIGYYIGKNEQDIII